MVVSVLQMMVCIFFTVSIFSNDTTISGTAYLLYASDNNQNFKISMLSADYLNVTEQVSIMDGKEGYINSSSLFALNK